MRKRWIIAVAVLLVAAGGYVGYWFWIAGQVNRNLDTWAEEWRAVGYRIEAPRSAVQGFPLVLHVDIGDIIIASPGSRHWTWTKLAGLSAVEVRPWQPFSPIVSFSGTSRLELVDGSVVRAFELSASNASADIALAQDGRPDTALFGGTGIKVTELGAAAGTIASASGRARLLPTEDRPTSDTAEFEITLQQLALPAAQQVPLGPIIAELTLRGRFRGSLPMGNLAQSLASWRDAGGTVELTDATADWGPLGVSGNATLALDRDLQPLAAGTAQIRGYAEAIDKAVDSGLMPFAEGVATKLALAATARPANGGSALEAHVPVTIQDGFLSVGPLKLMQMPHVEWW